MRRNRCVQLLKQGFSDASIGAGGLFLGALFSTAVAAGAFCSSGRGPAPGQASRWQKCGRLTLLLRGRNIPSAQRLTERAYQTLERSLRVETVSGIVQLIAHGHRGFRR
jgi:hypothetical protein